MKQCPRCHQDHGRHALRVAFATPSWSAVCRTCGIRFHPATTRFAIVNTLVFLPFFAVANVATPFPLAAVVLVLGVVLTCLAVRAWVPLVIARHS